LSCLSFLVALSLHVGLDNNYNSVHPHVRCDTENVNVGVYYNSERNISTYISKEYSFIEYGIVTGYSGFDIAPMIRFKKDNWFIAPAYETQGNLGFIVGWEYQISP